MNILYSATLGLLLAEASEALRFAAISGSSEFFYPVEQGWKDQCLRLGITDCPYLVPDFNNLGNGTTAPDKCEELILSLMEEGIDGLALGNTGCYGERMAPYVEELESMGIPVVLFDRDFVPGNRTAYVGTDNAMMGATMARLLKQLRPEGGTFVLVSTVAHRTAGFLEEITRDNDREDRAHWHQIFDETIDIPDPNPNWTDLMDKYAERHNPTAFIIMRQSPMRSANWTQHVDAHRHRGITYIGTDGSDYQLDYLSRKYVDGLIGQLPYEFGSISLQTLYNVAVEKQKVESTIATNLVAYNLIPLELPDLVVDQNLLHDLKYIGWVCFGIIALSVILCIGWTFKNRDGLVVKASQPAFLVMISCGVFIMGSTLIPLSFDDQGNITAMTEAKRIGICMSIPWLAFTGFTIAFSAMFSKTWRINKLVTSSAHFVRAKVETRDVIGPFLALITCNWIVLLCWTLIDPLKYDREYLPGTDFWNREFASAGSCQSEDPTSYLVLLGFLNLFVLCIACFQAFKARNIQTEFSEATYIGLSMYTLVQAYLSGIPIVIIVRQIPVVYYLVLTFLIFLLCMAILLFIFVPKILLHKKYKTMTPREQQNMMASKLRKSMGRVQVDSSLAESMDSDLKMQKQQKLESVAEDAKFVSAELRIKMSEQTSSSGEQVAAA